MKIAVVGGGLAGLTTAYDLVKAGADVSVFEASDRWGGKIFSSPVGDRLIDAGPDNFLARVPDATALCIELGLEDQLTVPVSPTPAYMYVNGALAALPRGTVLGVPTDFEALEGVISTAGIERAKLDLTLPSTPLDETTSVADYCRARLGDEVTDTLWAGSSGALLQIPLDPNRWVERACELVSRDLSSAEWERFVPGGGDPQPACV